MDKKQHERHTEILKNLLKRQDNKICCDCKKKDPRWASWNLGCFMCIRCSGIHRSLGVHISKVKSADLDNWKPNEIENVVKWGNAKANYYWESLLPTASSVSDANIEQFIRAKYERKQYVMSGPIPDPDTLILSSDCTTASPGSQQVQQQMQQQTQQVLQPAVQFQQSIQHQPPVQPQKQKTATDDLFDAFQSAPVQQVNSNSNAKSSILSLYGNTAQPRPASFASFPNQQSNNPSFGNMPQFNAPQQSAQSSGMSDFAGMSDFSFPKQTNKPAGMSDFSGLDFSPQKASIQSTGSNFGFPAGNAQGISSQGMSGMNSFGTPNQGIPVMNNFGTPNQGIPGMNSFGTPNQGIPGMNNFGTPNQGIPGMNNFGSPTQSTGGFSAGSMQSNQGLQSSQNFSSTMQPQKTSPSNGIPDFMNFGAKNAVGNTKPSTGGASTSNMDWGDFQ